MSSLSRSPASPSQVATTLGAIVGGRKASLLRRELEQVNGKLRKINASLRERNEPELVPEADEGEAALAYRYARSIYDASYVGGVGGAKRLVHILSFPSGTPNPLFDVCTLCVHRPSIAGMLSRMR